MAGLCAIPFVVLEVSGSGSSQPASALWVRDDSSPFVYQAGVAGYTLNSRWGDYPAVSADPSDAALICVPPLPGTKGNAVHRPSARDTWYPNA